MRRNLRFAFGLLVLLTYSPADADSSDALEHAFELLSRFQCHALGSLAERKPEQIQVHFDRGIASGKLFLSALAAKKISEDDFRKRLPMGVVRFLGGPSSDFMLGRLFEGISNAAIEEVIRMPGGTVHSIETWPLRADQKYREANCHVLR